MTGKEHYQKAERLLVSANGVPEDLADFYNAQAQVHATLALAAAQILPSTWSVRDRDDR